MSFVSIVTNVLQLNPSFKHQIFKPFLSVNIGNAGNLLSLNFRFSPSVHKIGGNSDRKLSSELFSGKILKKSISSTIGSNNYIKELISEAFERLSTQRVRKVSDGAIY